MGDTLKTGPTPTGAGRGDMSADPHRGADASGSAVRREAGEGLGRVRQEAGEAVQELREQGAAVAAAAQDRALSLAEQGKATGAEHAQGWARALHGAAEALQEQSPQIAHRIHDAADSVDAMARGLRERGFADLIGQARSMARQQPAVLFGAAALAGFALARFIKSSTPDAPHSGFRAPHRPDPDWDRDGTFRPEQRQHGTPGDIATPRPAGLGAPGWVPTDDDARPGGAARPATMAAASLGGAAAHSATRSGASGTDAPARQS